MTREEFVRNRSWILRVIRSRCELTQTEADYLNDLIEVLEQEPCEDCISRKQAMKACYQMAVRTGIEEKPYKYAETELAHLPSIQPKPKTGHWIIKEGREQGYDIAGIKTWYIQIMCDKCGFIKTAIEGHTGQYHFCPNCGAKMESEDKE